MARVPGREIVDDAGDDAGDPTSLSMACFSSTNIVIRLEDRSKASWAATPRLGRGDDTAVALMGKDEYAGGAFASDMRI